MLNKILFVHYGDEWIRGSERCVLDLMKHLDEERFLPVLWCNSDTMVEQAHKLGITTEQDDFKRCTQAGSTWSGIVSVTRMVSKALDLIDGYGIDVIHANSVAPCRWMAIAARLRNIPIIGHYHTRYQTRERYLSLSHWVDKIVGVSNDVVRPYIQDNCNQGNTRVIYNGIDYQMFHADSPLDLAKMFGIEANDFSLLSVGSLIERKGYQDLILAIDCLVKNGSSVKCVIVGGGPDEERLNKLISECGLQRNVFLTGQRYDVGRFYNSSFSAFISASRNEAFGLVNIEAAFCNKAVIAPDVDGLNEIFSHGQSAELFASNDPQIIANAIDHVSKRKGYRKMLQVNASQLAHEKFTVSRYVRQFEALYGELLDQTSSTRPSLAGFIKSFYRGWRFSQKQQRLLTLNSQQGNAS